MRYESRSLFLSISSRTGPSSWICIQQYTREGQQQAVREIERRGDKKFLPAVGTEPTVFVHIDKHQILIVVKYYTESRQRSEIKNQIVEEISRLIPGITDVDR